MGKKNKEQEVIEVEGGVVEDTQEETLRCEIRLGIMEDGRVYYNVSGYDQTIFTMEGLLKYARLETDKLWNRSINPDPTE